MTNERRVLVHPDKQALAGSVAARFITKTIDLLDDHGEANVVPDRRLRWHRRARRPSTRSPARDSVDWSQGALLVG